MTIREIAKLAGVSNAAVSRYLNGGSLSAEKHKRIQKDSSGIFNKKRYIHNEYIFYVLGFTST